MADDELAGELDRVLRTALTMGGQMIERYARARADADRARQAATMEEVRAAERDQLRRIEAGRAVYGSVRDEQAWTRPNAQRDLGEALVASQALQDFDPVARVAHQYIRAEARRRHGVDADAWLAAAVTSYLEEGSELADRQVAQDGATLPAGETSDREHRQVEPQVERQDGDRINQPGPEATAGEATHQAGFDAACRTAAPAFPRNAVDDHIRGSVDHGQPAPSAVAQARGRDYRGRS